MKKPLTVLSIIGTRPEAIKMAPVIRELQKRDPGIRSIVCATAQHREMLDQVLDLFGITPDIDLNIMTENQQLAELTATMLQDLDQVVSEHSPDWILAQGDTTTTMAASMIAYYQRVPFGHVEAGLRTGDKYQPYPEEVNRRVTDIVAELLFAPTRRSKEQLVREGIPTENIRETGNTVVDALLEIAAQPCNWKSGPLASVPRDNPLVLLTAHRRESFGDPIREIFAAVRELAEATQEQGIQFIYPVHMNPNVYGPAQEILGGLRNVQLLKPLDYLSLVHLMKQATLILTDSGGIQEEAPTFSVPVLVLRNRTERPEGIDAGVARLVGTDATRIVKEATRLLRDEHARREMAAAANPYGDGHAAGRIVSAIVERSTGSKE